MRMSSFLANKAALKTINKSKKIKACTQTHLNGARQPSDTFFLEPLPKYPGHSQSQCHQIVQIIVFLRSVGRHSINSTIAHGQKLVCFSHCRVYVCKESQYSGVGKRRDLNVLS